MSLISDINVDTSWVEFIEDSNIQNELRSIENRIGTDYTPEQHLVLRFTELDIHKLKVVILGQDPYKPAGVANGRAFQPSNLHYWTDKFRQVSLKNIVRNIYRSKLDIKEYALIPAYNVIIQRGFSIKQPPEWFDSLENQGVLFLNTSLTCKIGVSNSHKGVWEKFSVACIDYLASHNNDLYWFLWGKEAQNYKNIIEKYTDKSKIYESRHPMMCSESYSDDFLRNNCFKDTMDIINWLG